MNEAPVRLIAALNQRGYIGKAGHLMYRLPEDMKNFKSMTSGHVVIMGRKTWDSMSGPLNHRYNIVVTSNEKLLENDPTKTPAHTVFCDSVESAIEEGRHYWIDKSKVGEIWIIGGESVYRDALPHVQDCVITYVEDEKSGDAKFPMPAFRDEGFYETEDIIFTGTDNGHEIEITRFVRDNLSTTNRGLLWEFLGDRADVAKSTMVGREGRLFRIGALVGLELSSQVPALKLHTEHRDFTYRFSSNEEMSLAYVQLQELIRESDDLPMIMPFVKTA